MSSQLTRLIPRLRIPVAPKYRRLSNPEGSYGRLKILRRRVTDLVRDERIEANVYQIDETRQYAERLIQDAVKYGDRDPHMMEMANFWLEEKQLVHKLFKVLAPRYKDYRVSCTQVHRLPLLYTEGTRHRVLPRGVLELKENPFPPVKAEDRTNRHHLQNVLLDEARRQYRQHKYQQLTELAHAASPGAGSAPATDETPGGGAANYSDPTAPGSQT